ncbi:MAG: DUF3455 domain-containing protein [Caldimonas sp.]|uniref:DUF3455 domain-containing protein n=1 Tax=Caldimonas sp. TaxID=2838790 RepID=UPI00391AB3D3
MHKTVLLSLASLSLAACGSMTPAPMTSTRVDNMSLPPEIRVPAGAQQTMHTVGIGEITYECRAKAGAAGQFEWVFVTPVATLYDMQRKVVGKYYGGPTWEANDGSKVTGKQLAVAPAGPGDIPLQLVKADPAMGMGVMQGTSHIQRLNTRGGVAPSAPCAAANQGERRQVPYQADYVFYRQ